MGFLAAASLFIFGKQPTQVQAAKKSSSSLIIYFSKTGNTARAARQIQKETGGKLLRITPKKAYPNDYDATTRVAQTKFVEIFIQLLRPSCQVLRNTDTSTLVIQLGGVNHQ